MRTESIRNESLEILKTLRRAGFESYWAGGCVRDMLMGRTPRDYDIATAARPANVQALFSKTVAVGAQFGVISVVVGKHGHEVATFRQDRAYQDGRRPEGVRFCSPREDAKRRDFTVNAMFYDPFAEKLIDHVEGQRDLADRVLRAVGKPDERFKEDHLRMLRAVRLGTTLSLQLHPTVTAAIKAQAESILRISSERIQHELTRLLLEAPRAGEGVRQLHDVNLLKPILPEIEAMVGQEQPPQFHPEGDVFTHTCMMLDAMDEPDEILAYSVLLHDVGKPPTATVTDEPDGSQRIRFNGHAQVGAQMAEVILRRLKLPNRVVTGVVHCVAHHMQFIDVPRMKQSTLRRMVGHPLFDTELALHRLDCLASHGDLSNLDTIEAFRRAWREEPILPAPWVTGRDLLQLGLEEGPELGAWLKRAYERQLEELHPDRDSLLAWLQGEWDKETIP